MTTGQERNLTAGQQQTRALQTSQQRQDCAKALAHLCLMKRQATFSKEEADCWVTILAMFPTESVNRAMLQLGLSTDPFPDLGKIIAACQHIEAEKTPQVVHGESSPGRPSKGLVLAAAKALGLKV